MWADRNHIVHGHTCQEQATILLNTLHTQVSDHYRAFHNDNTYVLPCHHYLFKQCSLSDRLKHLYDYIKCWLRSVEEVRAIFTYLREMSDSFFAPFHQSDMAQTSHSSEDTSLWSFCLKFDNFIPRNLSKFNVYL
jgi:hypothetical protein